MILTTTHSIDGKIIQKYLSIVGAQSDEPTKGTLGSKLGFGGALEKIKERAADFGADVAVGVQFVGPTAHYYDTIHIYGTAVKLKSND